VPQSREEISSEPSRSPWFWLVVVIVPFVLFFAGIGTLATLEKWHISWPPGKENAEFEEHGPAPWLIKERRAELKRKIAMIDSALPAVVGEMNFLESRLKIVQARPEPAAREYIDFIRREEQFLADRLDEMRADRAYYSRELNEK
ncbi:MAG: hypothetical protein WAN65_00385, partial [Candidatus Sulfotelmatobacter sp.]